MARLESVAAKSENRTIDVARTQCFTARHSIVPTFCCTVHTEVQETYTRASRAVVMLVFTGDGPKHHLKSTSLSCLNMD